MSLSRHLLRRLSPPDSAVSRRFCTSTTSSSKHHHDHEFLPPTSYIKSWKPSSNPKDAAAQLAMLRREYARKVKETRKLYIQEMELQRIEKLRKDEARKEALRIANEERRLAKDAKKKAEAIERKAAEEEFRQMLMKERAEKLEYWRVREKKIEEKKKEKNELLRQQSFKWVEESKLADKALEVIVETSPIGMP